MITFLKNKYLLNHRSLCISPFFCFFLSFSLPFLFLNEYTTRQRHKYAYAVMMRKRRHNWRAAQLSYMGTDLAHNNHVYSYRAFHIRDAAVVDINRPLYSLRCKN